MSTELLVTEAIRSVTIFLHLLFFAMAVYTLLACDYAVWTERWNPECLNSITSQMKFFLYGLWATGAMLILSDHGTDIAAIVANTKLVFKLIVVTVLTLNGALIHRVAIPLLSEGGKLIPANAKKLTAMSAVSTSHWLLAALIGCFQPLALISPYLVAAIYLGVLIACALTVWLLSPITQIKINSRKAKNKLIQLGLREPDNQTISLLCLPTVKPNILT